MPVMKTMEERFWSHIIKSPEPDGCWLWDGYVNPKNGRAYIGEGEEARRCGPFIDTRGRCITAQFRKGMMFSIPVMLGIAVGQITCSWGISSPTCRT